MTTNPFTVSRRLSTANSHIRKAVDTLTMVMEDLHNDPNAAVLNDIIGSLRTARLPLTMQASYWQRIVTKEHNVA